MPQTFLLFDFGANEEAAQKARHQLDAWRQAFRPGNKVEFKIERRGGEREAKEGAAASDSRKQAGRAEPDKSSEKDERFRVIVRLDFSAHEKHLYRTWLDRIQRERELQAAERQLIERGGEEFEKISEMFRSLD